MIEAYPGIKIYDNVFSEKEQKIIYENCLGAPYTIGWNDTEEAKESHFYCGLGLDAWQNRNQDKDLLEFLNTLEGSQPYQKNINKILDKTIINCDTIADSHTLHDHKNQEVILYYACLDWKDGFGGETFFYDDQGKEVVYTSPYTPNRMIVFDGEILHRFNGPSIIGPKFRFSISTFFWKR